MGSHASWPTPSTASGGEGASSRPLFVGAGTLTDFALSGAQDYSLNFTVFISLEIGN